MDGGSPGQGEWTRALVLFLVEKSLVCFGQLVCLGTLAGGLGGDAFKDSSDAFVFSLKTLSGVLMLTN